LDLVQLFVHVLERALLVPKPRVNYALFFPSEKSLEKLLSLLHSATTSLDVCVYSLTDDRISDTILQAHHRGVAVRLITDDEASKELGADAVRLSQSGVPVRMDNSPSLMHNKFCIINKTILITGSFNWTRSASSKNNENVCVVDNQELISYYANEFERLWSTFGPSGEPIRHHEVASEAHAPQRWHEERHAFHHGHQQK